MSDEQKLYELHYKDDEIGDESMSQIMYQLVELTPHKSSIYTWDDLGMANLMSDCYNDKICYCPQNQSWYIWNGRWVKQPEDGLLHDRLETILNLLLIYVKEQEWFINDNAKCGCIGDDEKEKELSIIEAYDRYVRSLRKRNPMRNIIAVLATKVRKQLTDFDRNPYILNTTYLAYDLRDGSVIDNIEDYNVTMQTNTHLPDFLTTPCARWYTFIDEIMSHDKEKAKFLQRALGYSLLGVNREECMFVAYGAQSRNGKGTLFRAIENALGSDYVKTTSPDLICEKKNGDSVDFNAPQPMLATLLGARIVDMSESKQSARLDSASMKTMTGRDTLTTRGLYEKPFSFVPQFTLWVNTNYLPVVNDDTVFLSDRVWVIEFNEKFDGDSRDTDLKELFADPDNLPTILGWLVDGCKDYIEHGLNPPDCVRRATQNYRNQNDRIGRFLDECCEKDADGREIRGDIYQTYRNWCNTGDNRFKPIGSTTFYQELSIRGFHAVKNTGVWYIHGLKLKGNVGNRVAL